MDGPIKFEAEQFRRWLSKSGLTLRIWLTKAVLWVGAIYRFKSSFMNVLLFCLGYGFLVVACAQDGDSSSDRSQRHQHRRGNYGQEHSDADRSSPPIPGL
jgi:hypothetical protein